MREETEIQVRARAQRPRSDRQVTSEEIPLNVSVCVRSQSRSTSGLAWKETRDLTQAIVHLTQAFPRFSGPDARKLRPSAYEWSRVGPRETYAIKDVPVRSSYSERALKPISSDSSERFGSSSADSMSAKSYSGKNAASKMGKVSVVRPRSLTAR